MPLGPQHPNAPLVPLNTPQNPGRPLTPQKNCAGPSYAPAKTRSLGPWCLPKPTQRCRAALQRVSLPRFLELWERFNLQALTSHVTRHHEVVRVLGFGVGGLGVGTGDGGASQSKTTVVAAAPCQLKDG